MISDVSNLQNTTCAQPYCAQQPVHRDPKSAQQSFAAQDRAIISDQARQRLQAQKNDNSVIKNEKNLSADEKQQVDKLKHKDQEVKAHERAHMAGGSGLVIGGATYEYQRGPDGNMYAVGGEVKIDTSREKDPQATIRKMQKVRKAALAPSQPSATDRSVAAKASQIEAEARTELREKRSKDSEKDNSPPEGSADRISANPYNASSISPQMGNNISFMA